MGLLSVYTGDGKGKTTAALGMCVRAVGYDWRICLIQFVKGSWKYGELKGIKRLEANVELHVIGEGFVGIVDDTKDFEVHRKAAQDGIVLAREKVSSGQYQLVILDELNVAVQLGVAGADDLLIVGQAEGHEKQSWLVEVVIVLVDDGDLHLFAVDLVAPVVTVEPVGGERSARACTKDHDSFGHRGPSFRCHPTPSIPLGVGTEVISRGVWRHTVVALILLSRWRSAKRSA